MGFGIRRSGFRVFCFPRLQGFGLQALSLGLRIENHSPQPSPPPPPPASVFQG
jgi:hypothetical protein